MKIKYSKPTTKVILIKGGQHLLVDSTPTGIQSTMSGYSRLFSYFPRTFLNFIMLVCRGRLCASPIARQGKCRRE